MDALDAVGLVAHFALGVGSTYYLGYFIARRMPGLPGMTVAIVVALLVGGAISLASMWAILHAIESFRDGPWHAGETTYRMLQIVLLGVIAAPFGAFHGRRSKTTARQADS